MATDPTIARQRLYDLVHADKKHHRQLENQITELCAYIYAATYRLLVLIREYDDCGGWHQPGLTSCAHWLNFKCGIGMNAAREKVRVAHALKDLPGISAAFERGEVSYSKVRAMTRVANADNEDYLLMIARHGTAWHVEKLISTYRRCERVQHIELSNVQHKTRFLDYYFDEDGCLVFSGRVPPEQGALIVKALERSVEERYRDAARGDESDPNTEVHLSDVPSDDASAAQTSKYTDYRQEPLAARRADALSAIAERYLQNLPAGVSSADRYQVVVHIHPEDGSPVATAGEAGAYLEDGPDVSAETSRRLACDCTVIPIRHDASGDPLSVGRKTRSIPPAIRRALKVRDGGCRFPGCTSLAFVDGHHIQHWADGGETSLENLMLLCRYHHRLVHEGGYDCRRSTDGEVFFLAPDRSPLPDAWPGRVISEDPYVHFQRELDKDDISVDRHTCIPEWRAGEHMDCDLAVMGLQQLAGRWRN
jgi:hypothetical protein